MRNAKFRRHEGRSWFLSPGRGRWSSPAALGRLLPSSNLQRRPAVEIGKLAVPRYPPACTQRPCSHIHGRFATTQWPRRSQRGLPAGATIYVCISPHLGRPCRTPGSTISLHPLSVPPSCFTQSVCRSVPSPFPTHSFPANITRTLFITFALFRLVQSRSPLLPLFPLLFLLRSFFFSTPSRYMPLTSLPSFLHIWIPTATATDRPDSCNAPAPRQPCSEQAKQGPPSAQRSAPDRACHYNQPGRYIRGARLPFAPPARIPGPVCVGLRRKRHNATHCSRRTAISWKLHPHTHTLHW